MWLSKHPVQVIRPVDLLTQEHETLCRHLAKCQAREEQVRLELQREIDELRGLLREAEADLAALRASIGRGD